MSAVFILLSTCDFLETYVTVAVDGMHHAWSASCVGMWREGADGTDINACCRSHNQQLLASADDFGFVNLYEYPSSQPRVLYLLSVRLCVSVCLDVLVGSCL